MAQEKNDINQRLKFRRATHDEETGKYKEKFSEDNLTSFQKQVWEAHGNICHMLDSSKPMEFEEIFDEIRADSTNYLYYPSDLKGWRDGSDMPTPGEVAVALVRLLEAGFVEVVVKEQPKLYDYILTIEDKQKHSLKATDREGVKAWVKGYRSTSHYRDNIDVEEYELNSSVVRDTMWF